MFLAYCQKIQKPEETGTDKILDFLRKGFFFAFSEFITYPLAMFRTRACSYPRKKRQFPIAFATRKVFFGYSIGFQKSFITFLIRSEIYRFFMLNSLKIFPNGVFSKKTESCLISGFFTGVFMNIWNVTLIKSQCSPFNSKTPKARFFGVVKEIKEQRSSLNLFRSGFISFLFLSTTQGILEFEMFRRFYETKPERKKLCLFGTSLITTLIVSPLEFMNIRYVLRKLKGLETPNIFKYGFLLTQNEGIKCFYQGALLNFIRHFLFNLIIYKNIGSSYEISFSS